ncbi:MAG: hypothetical protein KJ726_00035 [Verrucomicrobia bacterium]|nr:hypothetical protein [Verrucomicrobiota bacterium]MBU1908419.1 hypothetical protein [Verrucomicrobiota bacterium]
MSRQKEQSYRITEEPRPDTTGPIVYGIGVLLCLLGIAYVGVFLASRTSGFRVMVEERLERRLGLPVSLKKVATTPALNLRLEGLATRDSDKSGQPGLRAREVLIGWSFAGWIRPGGSVLRSLTVQGGSVAFAPGATGRWEPATLEELGARVAEWGGFQLPDLPVAAREDGQGEKPEASESPGEEKAARSNWWEHATLDFEDGRMVWWDADGREQAAAEGLGLKVTPVTLPNRRMTHVYLTLDKGRVGDRQVHDLIFELLKTAEQDIVLGLSGDWQRVGAAEPSEPVQKTEPEPSAAQSSDETPEPD